jgi:hypothetical protein
MLPSLPLPHHTLLWAVPPAWPPLCTAGSESGQVKVWNFSSGQCLCTLHPRTSDEVTAIVALRIALLKQFLVGGWDRKVGGCSSIDLLVVTELPQAFGRVA